MSIKDKLNPYAEIPSNLDLENTMRERNGEPIILCVPLDDAILICQEEIREAKIKENKHWLRFSNSVFLHGYRELYRAHARNRIKQLKVKK